MLAETGDAAAVAVLADASLALARGEAMQRRQRHDPDTTIDDYLERCTLKTGKLFEAACVLGGGSGEYGRLLGVAFQIADDVLDCAGDTIETGKMPGTDLQDGTPTLPLLLAAQEDPGRARGARRRAEGGRARPRRGDRCARPVSRAGPPLRFGGQVLPRRRPAAGRARGAHAGRRREEKLIAVLAPQTLEPIREKIEAGERLDFDDGVAILESDDLLELGALADLARRVRGGTDEVFFVQNLYVNQTNVCRVKCKFCAFAATQKQEHAYTFTAEELVEDVLAQREVTGSPRSTWSTARTRTSTSASTATRSRRCTTRCPTCTSSATRRRRSTT